MRRLSDLGNFAADAIAEGTVALISWLPDGRPITANPPFLRLTGLTTGAVDTMKWPDDFCTRETTMHIRQAMSDLDGGAAGYNHDGMLVRKDGSIVLALLSVHQYCPGNGEEPFYYSFITDLSGYRPAAMAIDHYEEKTRQSLDMTFSPVRESGEFLRMIMDNVPQRIFWKDTHSVYQGCNKYFAVAAGVGTPDKIVGKADYDLAWTREQADAFIRDDREVMDSDRPKCHIIEPQRQADGSLSWLDTNKVPLHDSRGKVIGILGTYEDITDRRKLQEELKESQASLLKAQQIARLGSWEADLRTWELRWSDESYRILGFTPGAVKPDMRLFLSLIHPADRERIARDLRTLAEEGGLYSADYRVIHRDGSVRYLHSEGEVTFDETGQPLKLFGISQDITARKTAEIDLMKREADLAYSQKLAHIGSWRWNPETGKNEWSAEFYRILGLQPGAVEPDYALYMSLVHPDDRDLVIHDGRQALAENRSSSLDYRIVRPDGSIRYVHVEAIRIIPDRQGKPVGTFGTIQDITERKQVELSLEDAKTQAEMYLDLMGHDISNMDQVAMGFLELALETIDPDSPAREFILKPLEALKNSTDLIQRVKKLQQTKEGDIAMQDVDVGQVLKELLPVFSRVPGRTVTIHTKIDCNCTVKANELLRDVFENLIGNAIKHSTGPLDIRISADSILADGREYCQVSIEDNGPGIPDGLKKEIFSRFSRGAKKSSGRGLGLYLVKSLVDLYQGKVWVEDRVPGDYTQGVKFIVWLPVTS